MFVDSSEVKDLGVNGLAGTESMTGPSASSIVIGDDREYKSVTGSASSSSRD